MDTLDAIIIKYAFTYGPLMIFFFAVGYSAWKAAPVMLATIREITAALTHANVAIENSTRALNANTTASEKHSETVRMVDELWQEMRDRIDQFQCPAQRITIKPPTSARKPITKRAA